MAFNLVEQVVGYVIQTFLWLGLTRFSLKIARNEPASIADIFSEGGRLWPAVLINIVLLLAVTAGILLCVLPGIWIGLTLCMAFYMLLDQGVGVIDSLKYSAQATRGNKWVLLGLWLVSVGLMVIIGLPTCGLGMIFVYPYFMMVLTVAYLGATGQLGSVATAPAPYMTPPPAFE